MIKYITEFIQQNPSYIIWLSAFFSVIGGFIGYYSRNKSNNYHSWKVETSQSIFAGIVFGGTFGALCGWILNLLSGTLILE